MDCCCEVKIKKRGYCSDARRELPVIHGWQKVFISLNFFLFKALEVTQTHMHPTERLATEYKFYDDVVLKF